MPEGEDVKLRRRESDSLSRVHESGAGTKKSHMFLKLLSSLRSHFSQIYPLHPSIPSYPLCHFRTLYTIHTDLIGGNMVGQFKRRRSSRKSHPPEGKVWKKCCLQLKDCEHKLGTANSAKKPIRRKSEGQSPNDLAVKRLRRGSLSSVATTDSQSSFFPSTFGPTPILDAIEAYSNKLVVEELKRPAKASSKALSPANHRIQRKLASDELVFFDLETSGLSKDKHEILEIAAIHHKTIYNTYCSPDRKIDPCASRVNKITFKNGMLRHKGLPVVAIPIDSALDSFLSWLERLSSSGRKIVLVAHNANFDCRFITHFMCNRGFQDRYRRIVEGFMDTIPLFKKSNPGLHTYKQEVLVGKFLPDVKNSAEYDAHNAKSDVICLQNLFHQLTASKVEETEFNSFTFTTEYAIRKYGFDNAVLASVGPRDPRVLSFKEMVQKRVLTKSLVSVLASNNLNFSHLEAAYRLEKEAGIRNLLNQVDTNTAAPLITTSEEVITKIIHFMDQRLERQVEKVIRSQNISR